MDGKITIGTELDTKSFDAQIEALERDLEAMEKAYTTGLQIAKPEDVEDMQKLEVEIEKTKNKIVSLNKQKEKLGQTAGTDAFGNSLRKAVGQAGRLALAIFGIRSAYLAVRQASSTLASYDKQYAANLEYIRYALTQVIAPVLRWIVSLAATLLQIIGAIVNTLFGVNIFSKASAKDFQKMKAGASGTAKAAKEIKKQLAGFDEINILQDNTDTASGGAGGGVSPDFDLGKMGLDEGTLGKVKQLLSELLPYIMGIVTALTLIKLGLDPIKAIGIGVMIAGIIKLIQDLLAYLNDHSWENFGHIIQDIGIILIGLGIVIGNIPLIVAGAIAFIVGAVISNWETIRGILDNAIAWIDNAINNVTNFFTSKLDFVGYYFGFIGQAIWMTLATLVNSALGIVSSLIKTIRDLLNGLFTGIKQIFDGILKIFRGDFKGGIISIGKGIANALIGVINGIIGGINTFLAPLRAIIAEIGQVMGTGWSFSSVSIPTIPLLAKGGIVNMPNRGVMLGGAIAGESGSEGVIPLTDTQAMETLGQAIGRYITINANITNSMNGKVLSRELKRINNEQDFAYNT